MDDQPQTREAWREYCRQRGLAADDNFNVLLSGM
jgi:hypothetical protein